MRFDIKRTALALRAAWRRSPTAHMLDQCGGSTLLAQSAEARRSDHRAAVAIRALADDAGRAGGEFEACHHADAEPLAGQCSLALRRPQRPRPR